MSQEELVEENIVIEDDDRTHNSWLTNGKHVFKDKGKQVQLTPGQMKSRLMNCKTAKWMNQLRVIIVPNDHPIVVARGACAVECMVKDCGWIGRPPNPTQSLKQHKCNNQDQKKRVGDGA